MAAEDLPRQAHTPEDITEEHSFDELARGLATGSVSRRRALKLMGGALLGGMLASIPGVAVSQTSPPTETPAQAGSAGCPEGLVRCIGPSGRGECVDVTNNPLHCGTCGAQCGIATAPGMGRCCFNGVCYKPIDAPPGAVCLCSPGGTCPEEGQTCCSDNVCRTSC
jgi:hypothetical protein